MKKHRQAAPGRYRSRDVDDEEFDDIDDIDDADDYDEDREIEAQVAELRKMPGFGRITAKKLERALDSIDDGNPMPFLRVLGLPILISVMPRLLVGFAVLVVLFMLKWWVGFLCIIPFILYVVWCIYAKLREVGKVVDIDLDEEVKGMIADFF